MKTLKFANNIPVKKQMTWGGALLLLIAIAKVAFDSIVYMTLKPEASETLNEIGLSVREFYYKELILCLAIGLAGVFFVIAGLFSANGESKSEIKK